MTTAPPTLRSIAHPIQKENLYQPDKFNLFVGKGTVGFCTVWNEPKTLLKMAPELEKKAALVGTLYSSQGVNIIIRNLALNPCIRKIYVWGYGNLSNTKFGVMGTSVLHALWEKGVAEDGSIEGTPFKLEEEIDRAVLHTIREHVELIDVSTMTLKEAIDSIEDAPEEPYMDSIRFPDAVLKKPDTFPSEQVGWIIHGHTVVDAWTRLVERIMRYGATKGTQYGMEQKELIGATWVIHNEDPNNFYLPDEWPQALREVTGATLEAIGEYYAVFLSPEKPEGVSYTYGNRLMRYPLPGLSEEHIDQIAESIIGNITKSADTRRAVATTLVPWVDATSGEPPCITQVQCLQSGGALHMLVTARSHDIFKAALPNAFGLRMLQKRIADETEFTLGSLQITSQSAHIYEADWDNANKLATCAIWEHPEKPMTEADADPRGIFVIRLIAGKIAVDFNSKDGMPLLQFQGTRADELIKQIAKHELFSQSAHALDIGIQLARAEIALQKNIPFIQDRPLKL